jgi:hypothetical protein
VSFDSAGVSTRAEFQFTYDGEALREGRMPVRDLAPSLLSLADLFRDANDVLSRDGPSVELEIRATDTGSFTVGLALELTGWIQPALDVLNSVAVAGALNLVQIVTDGKVGLLYLAKVVGRQRIVNVEQLPEGRARVDLGDGRSVETWGSTVNVFMSSPAARADIRGVLTPLREHRVEELRAEAPNQEPLLIRADEAEDVDDPEPADDETPPVYDRELDMLLTIVDPSFTHRKWDVSDGTNRLWVEMKDEDFYRQIEDGRERFAKGDVIVCTVRQRQWERPGRRVETRLEIIKVHDHQPVSAPRPANLDLGDEEPPTGGGERR